MLQSGQQYLFIHKHNMDIFQQAAYAAVPDKQFEHV